MARPTLTELQVVPILSRPVRWLRRRRVLRRYLRAVATEMLGTTAGVEEVERRAAARADVLYQSTARVAAERSDILVEGLDRKVEGMAGRLAADVEGLRGELADLRGRVERLESSASRARPEPGPQPSVEPPLSS